MIHKDASPKNQGSTSCETKTLQLHLLSPSYTQFIHSSQTRSGEISTLDHAAFSYSSYLIRGTTPAASQLHSLTKGNQHTRAHTRNDGRIEKNPVASDARCSPTCLLAALLVCSAAANCDFFVTSHSSFRSQTTGRGREG